MASKKIMHVKDACDAELKKILIVGTVIWFQAGGFFILRNLNIGIAMRVD